MNLLDQIPTDEWIRFATDPLPGWCSRHTTAFDAPHLALGEAIPAGATAVCSVAFDTTASTRSGARYGPAAIRQATIAYSSQLAGRGLGRLRNMRTDRLQDVRTFELVDFGDLHVYPSDPLKQVQATAAEVLHLAQRSQQVVILGGEHLITYPAFAAVSAAGTTAGMRTGFLQIDHHFDFGDSSVLHGAYYHGSNARRISELTHVSLPAMGFVGVGDLTSASQFNSLTAAGAVIRSRRDIACRGFDTCLHEALSDLCSACDQIYVSIDIDVCDSSAAPGTGNVTVGGISATELLMIPSVLHDYPVVALDIVEVNPTLDPSGVTTHLAARLLFEWLYLRDVPQADLEIAALRPDRATLRS